jgi:hypothetical protein
MPRKFTKSSKFTSPFTTSFKSGIKSGTPCGTVITNIAKRTNKPVASIIKSLTKAGVCFSQKFNGTLVCWPAFPARTNATKSNICQTNLWQCFVDWCIMTGVCKPNQLNNKTGSQKSFMSACKSYFGKQFSSFSTTKSKRKSKSRKSWTRSRKTTSRPKTHWAKHTRKRTTKRSPSKWSASWTRSYKFPTYRVRSTTRRYVRAA